jgi:uncharacterized protein
MSDVVEFLEGDAFAVVGASNDRAKFGNKVLRCYWDHGKSAYPVNPQRRDIEGAVCHASLAELPGPVHGVSVITPPAVSEAVVEQAHAAGATRIWFQPGAESRAAIDAALRHGMMVIAGGPCVLVELPQR